MIFDNKIFVFLFFAVFTEIINYLFNNNVLTSNIDNETKFVVIINNIELSVYPFFKALKRLVDASSPTLSFSPTGPK